MMKFLYAILLMFLFVLASCNPNREKTTERTVIGRDTIESETEYEIEKTIREKTVTIDTIKEKETVTTEKEYDEEGHVIPDENNEYPDL